MGTYAEKLRELGDLLDEDFDKNKYKVAIDLMKICLGLMPTQCGGEKCKTCR
jgi:hypothetical protein